MENKYQNMMDQVRASEGLRGSVLGISKQERTKKTRPAPMRVLTVAACICALLVTAAMAAEVAGVDVVESIKHVMGIQVTEIYTVKDENGEIIEGQIGWSFRGSVKPEHLSEAFWADVQSVTFDEEGFADLDKDFYSREELENYLGVTLPDNPMLEKDLEQWHVWSTIREKSVEQGTLYIHLYSPLFEIEFSESGEQQTVSVHLEAWTSTLGESASIGYQFPNVTESARENYVTPNGLETAISILHKGSVPDVEGLENPYIECIADFYLNGLNYRLYIIESPEREDLAEKVMKRVLDAYQ